MTKTTKCHRCGNENPADVHTCTPKMKQTEKFRIGDFVFERWPRLKEGNIWFSKTDGEGMEINEQELSDHLDALFMEKI